MSEMHITVKAIFLLVVFMFLSCDVVYSEECEDIRVTATAEDLAQIEKDWGGVLSLFSYAIETAFEKTQPSGYQKFAEYKTKYWLPSFIEQQDMMNCAWSQFGVFVDPDHQAVKSIVLAMTDLNTVSINMQSYLKNHRQTDLDFIKRKMPEINAIAKQYEAYRPK